MLAEIQDRMERASIAISADYRGLTGAQITELVARCARLERK